MYHYFADKDALVLEVITRQTKRVLDAQQPHLGSLDSLPALIAWRDAMIRLNKATRGRECPLGSLASELANESEPARKRLAGSFVIWHERLEMGLPKCASAVSSPSQPIQMNWLSPCLAPSRAGFF